MLVPLVICSVLLGSLIYWLFKPVLVTLKDIKAADYDWKYFDPATKVDAPFPSLFDRPSKTISFVSPAYNEQERIPIMLRETIDFLITFEKKHNVTWELIIVDDGSRDKTGEVVLSEVRKYGADRIRLLTLTKNQGKGGAVQQGILHSRGEYILFADADGATKVDDFAKLFRKIKEIEKDGMGLVVGSRAHLEENAVATRKWYRNILMYGFHFLVSFVGGIRNIRDTQCGFKIFTRKTSQWLFFNQHLRRWSFDTELLYLGLKLNVPMAEVAVNWTEIPGSKVNLVEASFAMARDLLVIRLAYLFRIWVINDPWKTPNPHLKRLQNQ